MHIVCLYQHYANPDCAAGGRAYAMLRHLARRHRVTLITSRAGYDARLTRTFAWVPEGVALHMLDVHYDNRMDARRRLRAYGAFAAGALLRGLRVARPDLIYGISTPLTTGWAAMQLARLRRVPWVFEIRDLWPDFPIQMGALPTPWMQRRLYALEHTLYHRAAHVITVSPDMTDHVGRQGVAGDKVTTLLQGTDFDLLDACRDEDLASLRARYGLGNRRVLLYAGAYGRANDIPTLIHTARRLAHREDLAFVFMGQGYEEAALHEAARTCQNLFVLPPQPRHQVFPWFRLASVSLVSFLDLPVLATNAPAKFFDSLAAGTPVLVTNPGWTRQFVETHRCGWYAPASDPEALAAVIARLADDEDGLIRAGQHGAAIARRSFDRAALAQRLEALMERVAGS